MTWFAFKGYNNGRAVNIAGLQEKEAVTEGFHGYATEAQAEGNPNTVASFPNPLAAVQKEFVNGIMADYGYAVKAGEQPGGKHATLTPGNVAAGTAQAAANSIPGLSQIGAFFSALGQANTWIRVAKVIIGGVLVIIGLSHITGADNSVANAARRAPLPI